ncbi:bestrophin-2-like [Stomoxys calcitrans]|uniref:Bestrophin homolog n=1 Tax=Stomoxys calcitrans TaxID=35570 RepID=A0A1I8PJQ1_STOCA|nr:bestrophin-2-like [Stomoxys calcitrans]
MTVSYTAEVAQCRGFGCFPKLLLRWRASIYKLIWLDLLIYLTFYYALSLTYRFYLNESQKEFFEMLVKYCNSSTSLIPLMFLLGFYVSVVVKRWWEQYLTLPWPDSTAVYVSSLIKGQDENGRKMRRTIMRYVCLSLAMVFTRISPRVKKRFPTYDQMVEVGLLMENEKDILKAMNEKFAKHAKHWMPIVWAAAIVTRARKEGRIRDDSSLKTLIDSLNSFRGKCMVLTFYDSISIPLVYTQLITIAVYTFFLASVFGRQWTGFTDPDAITNIVDFFPIFTLLEFMFFMGWVKVAESLICPFGEDDDDFELNWLIDRSIQVSYLIVDEMHNEHPELLKDHFWKGLHPTQASNIFQFPSYDPPPHSTAQMEVRVPENERSFFKIPLVESFSHLFCKRGSQPEMPVANLMDNHEEVSASMLVIFEPDKQSSTAIPSNSVESKEMLKTTKIDQIAPSLSADQNVFEQLRAQRTHERLQRQNYLIAMSTTTEELAAENNSQISVSEETSESSQEFKTPQEDSKKNV